VRSLTGRGRVLVAVGLVGIGAGWGLRLPAVTAVALLLILVPAIGVITVRRSRFVLGSARTVTPTRIPFGSAGEVVLTVENGSRFTSGVLLLEDAVPASLGDPTRLLLDRIPSRAQRSQRYPVTGRQRGRARIGPLTVTVTDPFGTASTARSFTATNTVLVTPQIVELGSAWASVTPGGHGETRFRAISSRGDDDLLPREHRAGDDSRRIHWPATARQGELMVRREEQAWHSSVTVILDDDDRSHDGTASTSTFEWAVSAAASVAVHFIRHGWRVTVLTTSGRVLVESWTTTSAALDDVLQAFADVQPARARGQRDWRPEPATIVVAVLGHLSDDSSRPLARPAAGFAGCLLLEPGTAEGLRAQGWRVAHWTPTTSVAEAWQQIAPVSPSAYAVAEARA
jgi:uncharacterized protein (DUF58 family)